MQNLQTSRFCNDLAFCADMLLDNFFFEIIKSKIRTIKSCHFLPKTKRISPLFYHFEVLLL